MANYTKRLNLEKPLQTEFYNVDVFNGNFDKIDDANSKNIFNMSLNVIGDLINMNYIKIIESSTTWLPPQAGTYKAILVGGGACSSLNGNDGDNYNGGDTTLGSIATATGGVHSGTPSPSYSYVYGGFGGFELDGTYGGVGRVNTGSSASGTETPPTKNGGILQGLGYGATSSYYSSETVTSGFVNVVIFTISDTTPITVTVGQGGVNSGAGGYAGNNGVCIIMS